MNSNGKHKTKKAKISNKLSKTKLSKDEHLSFSTKDGTVLFSKARNNPLYLTTASNNTNLNSNVSALHMQLNRNKTLQNQRNESLFKIKEEMADLKEENQRLLNENLFLKEKLLLAEKTIEKGHLLQHNAIEDNEELNENRFATLLSQSLKFLEVFIDMMEVLLFQTKSVKSDATRMMMNSITNNNNNNNDHLSFSIDVYEPSISNDDDRRICLLEQIQSLILFKLKIFQDQFGIDIDNMKARISEWNKSYIKDKENISNSVSFCNISQIKSKAQQNVINANSLSYSDYNTSSNINVPLSPKFYKDEASDFCKSLNESAIKGFNDKEDDHINKYSFTEEPKLSNDNSALKSIYIKENEQEPEILKEVLMQFKQNEEKKEQSLNKNEEEEEEEKVLHTFNNDNEEEHKANIWNNHIEISFEGKFT